VGLELLDDSDSVPEVEVTVFPSGDDDVVYVGHTQESNVQFLLLVHFGLFLL
jgi:hypothetical protein